MKFVPKFFAFFLFLFASSVDANQSRDAQSLAAQFNLVALDWGAPLDPVEDTVIDRVVVSNCIWQVQSAIYSPANGTVRFSLVTMNIGDTNFQVTDGGKPYTFAAYALDPNRGRIDVHLDPPNGQFNTQVHDLDLNRPMRAAVPTAWSPAETFGGTSHIMVGDLEEADIANLVTAFTEYKDRFCS